MSTKTAPQPDADAVSKAEQARRKAFEERRKTIHMVMGSCRTAEQIEAGELHSSTTIEQWHDRCPGAHIDQVGRVTRCTCECHPGFQRCIRCKIEGTEGETLDESLRCINEGACIDRVREQMENGPEYETYRRFEGYLAAGRAARAEETQTRPRERTPKVRPDLILDSRCEHCGEPTKGGKFVAGHDAKLKGLLLAAAKDLDVEALAEMIARSWVKDGTRAAIKEARIKVLSQGVKNRRRTAAIEADAEVLKLFGDAEELLQETPTHQFLTRRTHARLEAGS